MQDHSYIKIVRNGVRILEEGNLSIKLFVKYLLVVCRIEATGEQTADPSRSLFAHTYLPSST